MKALGEENKNKCKSGKQLVHKFITKQRKNKPNVNTRK